VGQFYLFLSRDKDGNPLNRAETYCLHVPPMPPVQQYWPAVLYDFATHALIRDMPYGSRSLQSPGLQIDTDSSVDVYFAPKAPDGKKSNWIPTDAKGGLKRSSASTVLTSRFRSYKASARHRAGEMTP
jgi:hypothetical protein